MIRITNKIIKLILLFFALNAAVTANAQLDPISELIKLNASFKTADPKFNIVYYYEEDDSAGVIKDTLSGIVISNSTNGNTWMRLGGMKKISNEYYFTLVDTVNQEIYIGNPQSLSSQFAISELTNTEFVAAYVDTITETDSVDCGIINIDFKENSPYNNYQAIYKLGTYQMVSLSYSQKKEADTTNWVGSSLPEIRLKIAFSGISSLPDSDPYNTNKYFIRKNGVFVLQPAYSGYQLIDMTGTGGD